MGQGLGFRGSGAWGLGFKGSFKGFVRPSPKGPSTQTEGFQGPKNNSESGLWDRKPLGSWCLGFRVLGFGVHGLGFGV